VKEGVRARFWEWGWKFLYMNFEYVVVNDDGGSKRVEW
jgi:hypothetical protein